MANEKMEPTYKRADELVIGDVILLNNEHGIYHSEIVQEIIGKHNNTYWRFFTDKTDIVCHPYDKFPLK
jgi:hypothetical protein